MKAIVKFSFGESHPLYNLPVEAEIKPCCGYDGMQIDATTVSRVYFPANPEGIFIFKGDDIVGYKESPARVENVTGWVKEIFIESTGKWVSAKEFCEYLTYLKLKEKFEN